MEAKLIKVRCVNNGSSSLADWYKEIALYQWKNLFWISEREFNTMGNFISTEEAFPEVFKNIKSWHGEGKVFNCVYQAANELLGYNWSPEELQFKISKKTFGNLIDFQSKEWWKVDSHLKPSLKELINLHSPEKVMINQKETTLVSIKESTTKLAFLDGKLLFEWRPFCGGTYFEVFTSVTLEVDGWKIWIEKETLESLYK